MNTLALYFHIPFCNERKCDYCSFISFCNKKDRMDEYVDALIKEIKMRGAKEGKEYKISSIFFGGGTPSVLSDGQMTKIMIAIKQNFRLLPNAEITIEANPESITESKLREYLLVGVNRLSIGVQSLNDKLLAAIGRRHTSKQAKEALSLAKKIGFKNINVDMMIGLPEQTLSDVKKTVKYLIKERVNHVSAYSLILEPGTVLQEKVRVGVIKLPSEDETVEMYNLVLDMLSHAGIKRYEVSNFAMLDYECKHNQNYWRLGEYLAFGVGGHSYMKDTRFANTDDFDKYLQSIENNTLPIVSVEKLSFNERREETIMLALRTREGLNLEEFDNRFGGHFLRDKKKEIEFLSNRGFISLRNGYLKVSENAYYVLNSIILKLV